MLGSSDLAANTDTNIYQCPSGQTAVVNVSICNRNSSPVNIRLMMSVGGQGSITNNEYLEYDYQLLANSAMERTGLIMSSLNYIVAHASTTGVSVIVYGIAQ